MHLKGFSSKCQLFCVYLDMMISVTEKEIFGDGNWVPLLLILLVHSQAHLLQEFKTPFLNSLTETYVMYMSECSGQEIKPTSISLKGFTFKFKIFIKKYLLLSNKF